MMKIEAVIFDLDGTLLDSMHVWKKIDVDFLAKRSIIIPSDYTREVSSRSFREAAEYTIERFALPETADDIICEWNKMAIDEYSRNITLKSHAKEYLTILKENEVALGIATSLTSVLYEPALAHNGVRSFFDVICSADEVERGKAFPDIFLCAAERLKVQPENCLVFEDIPQAIKSAKLAGMWVYGVYDVSSKEYWEDVQQVADGVLYDFCDAPLFKSA